REVDVIVAVEGANGRRIYEQDDTEDGPGEDHFPAHGLVAIAEEPCDTDECDDEGHGEVHVDEGAWQVAVDKEIFYKFEGHPVDELHPVFPDDEIQQGHGKENEEDEDGCALEDILPYRGVVFFADAFDEIAGLQDHHDEDEDDGGCGVAEETDAEHGPQQEE